MIKKYLWNGREIQYNERYNSLLDMDNHAAMIPAVICDAIRYMAAFRIRKLVINNQYEINLAGEH